MHMLHTLMPFTRQHDDNNTVKTTASVYVSQAASEQELKYIMHVHIEQSVSYSSRVDPNPNNTCMH